MDLLLAVLLDWRIGDPAYRLHPIRLMGHLITFQESVIRRCCKSPRGLQCSGGVIVVLNGVLAFIIPFFMLRVTASFPLAQHIINTFLLYTVLSAGCLRKETIRVMHSLGVSVEHARRQIAMLVGRETADLNKEEITTAAVETSAENTCDGVIAPLFFALLAGAPGAVCYKMINTMDSMLGYKTEKYRHIGFFSAKTDDVFSFIPARITAVCMLLGSLFRYPFLRALRIMIRDRRKHASPNSGYPESAVAGLLGIRLGGAHWYHGEYITKPHVGEPLRTVIPEDIHRVNGIMFRAQIVFLLIWILFTAAVLAGFQYSRIGSLENVRAQFLMFLDQITNNGVFNYLYSGAGI